MTQLHNKSQAESLSPPKRKKKKKVRKLLPTPIEHRPNRTTKRREKPNLKDAASLEDDK
jgi:hypothetical protein